MKPEKLSPVRRACVACCSGAAAAAAAKHPFRSLFTDPTTLKLDSLTSKATYG